MSRTPKKRFNVGFMAPTGQFIKRERPNIQKVTVVKGRPIDKCSQCLSKFYTVDLYQVGTRILCEGCTYES